LNGTRPSLTRSSKYIVGVPQGVGGNGLPVHYLEATTLAVRCWHIWDARNDARHNHAKSHPKSTCVKISSYVDMILQHCV
jgi:hypothetical protein